MNGIHDLGGMHGFAPVEVEREEPVFHAEWEERVFALTLAAGFLGSKRSAARGSTFGWRRDLWVSWPTTPSV